MIKSIYFIMIISLLFSCSENKEDKPQDIIISQDSINKIVEKAKQDAIKEQARKEADEATRKLAEESKKFGFSDVVGVWNITMRCIQSDCPSTSIGDIRTETWHINYENYSISVVVIGNKNTNRDYEGDFNGKKLTLKNEVDNGSAWSSSISKTNVELIMKNEKFLEGIREVLNPDPCIIRYYVSAIKN